VPDFFQSENYQVRLRPSILLPVVVAVVLSACYKEFTIYPDPSTGDLNFLITIEQEELIYNARGYRFSIEDPLPILYFENSYYGVDRFEIRGESTLNYRRKSFSVNMDDNIILFVESENRAREFEEYKLIALVHDYTYIENCIAIGFFHELDLWPTYSVYTEVKLNNNTQGLYLFIEDPVEHFLYQQHADFILRRNYNHYIDNYHINENQALHTSEYYINRFNSIYSFISEYSGEILYDSLMSVMDLHQYFKKIALDMLLENGDYTDEIFFYSKRIDNKDIFGVYPWDYDDLFSEHPHEIGINWGCGTVFGTRYYGSIDDEIADVGFKLLFSIEDDLDYKIAIDDYLYQKYLGALNEVVTIIDDDVIEAVIQNTKNQLQPFYNNDAIIAQSQYDRDETNQVLFDENLAEKRQLLLDRRAWIINELSN
jgi:hypothetical protein